MRGQNCFWVHWNLYFKLLKLGHFWINFRFLLVWVQLRKAKLWVHWIFYKEMKNNKLGHTLSFYMHRKIISSKKIKKILGISKAIRVLESPLTMYLVIWVFCPYIQRSLSKARNGKNNLLRNEKKGLLNCYLRRIYGIWHKLHFLCKRFKSPLRLEFLIAHSNLS